MSDEQDRGEPLPEELSDEERRALAAWVTPPAPRDLAARALARARAPRVRKVRLAWALAAGLAAAGLLLLLAGSWREEGGSLTATRRTTVGLGARALAVAEAGAELGWQARSRALRVQQTAGNVFYRVERGGAAVEVETPTGTVRVLGTCFRVEVETMRASRAGLVGAAAGVAATLVVVTVYEGKVMTASAKGQRELAAGQVGELRADRPPRLLGEVGGGSEAAGVGAAGERAAAAGPGALADENRALRAEKRRLEEELEGMRAELTKKGGGQPAHKFLNLDKEDLQGMAKRCELRWDMPPSDSTAPEVEERAIKELGLTEAEQAGINKGLAEYHKEHLRELRKLFLEVTGQSKVADSLSPGAMISEIEDKTPRGERKQVFQGLARERAGLEPPPASLAGASVTERLYRLLTTSGDRAEKLVGAEVGPDLARRYREAFDGFGSRSRSTSGCPAPN